MEQDALSTFVKMTMMIQKEKSRCVMAQTLQMGSWRGKESKQVHARGSVQEGSHKCGGAHGCRHVLNGLQACVE